MAGELKNLLDSALRAQTKLRDEHIEQVGINVTFQVPTGGVTYDEYGDPSNVKYDTLATQVIIKWGDYHSLFSEQGISSEDNPIVVTAKIKDNIPKGSLVNLTYINKDMQRYAKLFIVLGEETIHRDQEVSKVLKLAPKR